MAFYTCIHIYIRFDEVLALCIPATYAMSLRYVTRVSGASRHARAIPRASVSPGLSSERVAVAPVCGGIDVASNARAERPAAPRASWKSCSEFHEEPSASRSRTLGLSSSIGARMVEHEVSPSWTQSDNHVHVLWFAECDDCRCGGCSFLKTRLIFSIVTFYLISVSVMAFAAPSI